MGVSKGTPNVEKSPDFPRVSLADNALVMDVYRSPCLLRDLHGCFDIYVS